jgi:predicted heme/steroid binding protein/uncharacterized membrane protein
VKKDDLQKFNGQDSEKAYVSYKGKVYDVTDSRLWKNGKHVNKHMAGMDLTEALESAPHGMDVLERFAHVDTIEGFRMQKEESGGKKALIKKLYRITHPHPMLIHFPMGLLVFTVIMQAIFLYYKDASFETAAFYSLFTAVVFTVPTIVSGMVSWWVNYELAKTKIFMNKLIFSFILLAMGIVEVAIRITHPHLADGSGGLGMFYNVMLFLNIPVLAVVGFNGGKLSWG